MFAKIAVSVAVAFVGALPLAEASGLLQKADPHGFPEGGIITSSGILLFFLTISLVGPTLRLGHKILETLKQVEQRPNSVVALTMLVLGTSCSISAMVIQYNAGLRVPTGLSMNLNGLAQTPQVMMQSSSSLGLGILTVLTFLLGTTLIALGIWASLKPVVPSSTRPIVKPPSREFEEVAS